jgi:thioesterase domain-containing protein
MSARLAELRGGAGDPLFIMPGAGGVADELVALAEALRTERPVIAVEPFDLSSIESMADRAAAAIRARQPNGPYWVVGYSFGGLIALEAAERLRAAGETVAFLGLIDAVYEHRYWPAAVFCRALVRRSLAALAGLVRQPPVGAAAQFMRRTAALGRRLVARRRPVAMVADDGGPQGWRQVMAAWRPRAPDMPITLFASRADGEFGCDPADLWRPLIADLTVRRIRALHLELVREPAAVAALAQALDAALDMAQGRPPPRVLLAAKFGWPYIARLALSLQEASFEVHAVCPRRHVLWRLSFAAGLHRLRRLHAAADIQAAIAAVQPELVVPCDDRVAQRLHALHAAADPATVEGAALRELLVRSLGPAAAFELLYARADFLKLAGEEGVPAPATAGVAALSDLKNWLYQHPGTAVLKTDGAWGGRELAFIDGHAEAARAYRRLSRPVGPVRALKRLLVDGDAAPLRALLAGRAPALSVQAFVPGRAGNVAVACLDGEVLGLVCAEVERSHGACGPATVVRVVSHRAMSEAATVLVRRLGLSGLCGFDFILDDETGEAQLIEINPRATPTAHLIGARGENLAAELAARLRRGAPPKRQRPVYAGALVALFPDEIRRDPRSEFLSAAFHDVPWHAPELVDAVLAGARSSRAALEMASPRSRGVIEMFRFLRPTLTPSRRPAYNRAAASRR